MKPRKRERPKKRIFRSRLGERDGNSESKPYTSGRVSPEGIGVRSPGRTTGRKIRSRVNIVDIHSGPRLWMVGRLEPVKGIKGVLGVKEVDILPLYCRGYPLNVKSKYSHQPRTHNPSFLCHYRCHRCRLESCFILELL